MPVQLDLMTRQHMRSASFHMQMVGVAVASVRRVLLTGPRPPAALSGPEQEPVVFVGRTHGRIVPARGNNDFGCVPCSSSVMAV